MVEKSTSRDNCQLKLKKDIEKCLVLCKIRQGIFFKDSDMKRFAFFCFSFLLLSSSVSAQIYEDNRAVWDKIDRLERDLTLLQRKIYKTPEVNHRNASTSSSEMPEVSEETLSGLYAKIARLEMQNAAFTGQIEEMQHALSSLEDKIKAMNADVNFRFEELEKIKNKPALEEKTDNKKSEINEKIPADKMYQEAYDFLMKKEYEKAADMFSRFLEQYPDDKLTPNAAYWLAESYYAQGENERAAVAFADSFKKYKTSSKGADSLFKLGKTMILLNKKDEACQSFRLMKKEYPKADAKLLLSVDEEMKKLSCE